MWNDAISHAFCLVQLETKSDLFYEILTIAENHVDLMYENQGHKTGRLSIQYISWDQPRSGAQRSEILRQTQI